MEINHFIPSSIKEALDILSKHDCFILAGGTDLMVQKHKSKGLLPNFDKDVIYISNLKDLDYEFVDENGDYHIGATTKYFQLENSKLCPQILKDIISEIASPNIRNMATLAGNIGNASPAGDALVGLYLLNAKIKLSSVNEERIIPINEFIKGVRKIDRKSDELITEIIIPNGYRNLTYYWRKVGSREAESISKLSFLGAYEIKDNKINDLRIAFGSVSTTVVRKIDFEKDYIGLETSLLPSIIDSIVSKYYTIINPITDQRSNKDYRKKVAMNLLNHFLNSIK